MDIYFNLFINKKNQCKYLIKLVVLSRNKKQDKQNVKHVLWNEVGSSPPLLNTTPPIYY